MRTKKKSHLTFQGGVGKRRGLEIETQRMQASTWLRISSSEELSFAKTHVFPNH